MDEIATLQADVLRTLASPRRLEILNRLAAGPCEVGRLARDLGPSQPSVSQHLAVLRGAGVMEADPDVMVACGIMRSPHQVPTTA